MSYHSISRRLSGGGVVSLHRIGRNAIDVVFTLSGWAPESAATSVGSMEFFKLDYTFWLNLVFIVVGLGLWRLSKQAPQQAHCCAHHGH